MLNDCFFTLFDTGKPAMLSEFDNPDWIPSIDIEQKTGIEKLIAAAEDIKNQYNSLNSGINMLIDAEEHQSSMLMNSLNHDHTYHRGIAPERLQNIDSMNDFNNQSIINSCVDVNLDFNSQSETDSCDEFDSPLLNSCSEIKLSRDKCVGTDLTMDLLTKQELVLQDQVVSIGTMRHKLLHASLTISNLDGNDYKTKYLTGLKYYATLKILYDNLEPFLLRKESHILNKEQLLLLTLMKLRLGEDFKSLAFRFNVSEPVVSKAFHSCIEVLYTKLHSLVEWKEKKQLIKTMPASFKKNFGNKVSSIIDCTEIFIETPSNPKAAAECFSQYKNHHTIKYLIAISPQRVVTFISVGYGGRATDGFITNTCGLLDQVRPGDYVLADKGFRMDEEFALRGATLEVPAFVIKKRQLHPLQIEKTRKLANVRIHVERIIGTVKQKYMILENTIPISMLVKRGQFNVSYIDQIIVVCCALFNLCPSIIYAV